MNWPFLFLSMQGRIKRAHFWAGVGVIVGLQILVQIPVMSAYGIDPEKGNLPLWFRNLSLLLDVLCAWPLCAVMVKRQQDRDQGPQLTLTLVTLLLAFSALEAFGLTQQGREFTFLGYATGLPLLGLTLIALFELGGRRGTAGPNRFGPEPS